MTLAYGLIDSPGGQAARVLGLLEKSRAWNDHDGGLRALRIALDDKPIPDIGPLDALMRITTTTLARRN